MASSTNAQVRNLHESRTHAPSKTSHSSRRKQGTRALNEEKANQGSSLKLIQKSQQYEKYCRYWSILSNIAALVSVGGAVFGLVKKRRWL